MSALLDAWSVALLVTALGPARPGRRLSGWRPFITGSAGGEIVGGVLSGRWDEVALCAAVLAVLAWHRRSGRGKRAAKAVGAKSRALVDGLVERLRDALEPVPEGVRA